jgi:hypothetical protein
VLLVWLLAGSSNKRYTHDTILVNILPNNNAHPQRHVSASVAFLSQRFHRATLILRRVLPAMRHESVKKDNSTDYYLRETDPKATLDKRGIGAAHGDNSRTTYFT